MKLLEQLRQKVAQLHLSPRTADCYCDWTEKFLRFNKSGASWKHPSELSVKDVERFLTHLAVDRHVTAATQNQAMQAIIFLYKHLLGVTIKGINCLRAKRSRYVPAVLSQQEIAAILEQLQGGNWLRVMLMYGCGLRIGECLGLRIQDIDLDRMQLTVRGGKGKKDRCLPLPQSLCAPVAKQLARAEQWWKFDMERGAAGVPLPNAFGRKSPTAHKAVGWYWLFPSHKLSREPGRIGGPLYRFHRHGDGTAKALRRAALKARIRKRVKPHILRHSFASHHIENGTDIRVLMDLMGHASIKTTQIYLHVKADRTATLRSPLEVMLANPQVSSSHNLRIA